MKLTNKKNLLNLSVMLALTLTNCAAPPANDLNPNTQVSSQNTADTLTQLKGRVVFSTKATVDDVKPKATVSLIYPSDYSDPLLRNKTVSTGLTDSNGNFKLNTTPQTNVVYILEAIKRIGGAGNYQMALRTNVRWTGSAWTSITTPDIVINSVTTALAIISNLNPQDISSGDTIGKIPSPYTVPNTNINGNVTSDLLNNVNNQVNQVLSNDQDPVASIYFSNNQYLIRPNPVPIIGEFQVNTFTSGGQYFSSVAMDSNGNYVIAWNGNNQDGSNYGIFAQRYNNLGGKMGSEFQVNTFTTGGQLEPSVAMDSAGDFVVSWSSTGQDGSYSGIYAQRYNSSGVKVGSEFQVNTYTTKNQSAPSAAMDSAGDFVVSWQSENQDGSSDGIFAQRYNSSGVKAGSEFQVNTFTTNSQRHPSIAMDSAGDFVISWNSDNQDGSNYGIFAQRYNNLGGKVGSEFQVNTYTTGDQDEPSAAMDSAGDFVVSWSSTGQDGSYLGIYAQRYNSSGVKVGSEFQVNTYTTNIQEQVSAAMDSAGDFVVSWSSPAQDGSSYGIFAQRYNNLGGKVGSEFQVNTFTTGNQSAPSAAMDSAGDFVISWQSTGQDGSSYGVFAQRYNKDGVAK